MPSSTVDYEDLHARIESGETGPEDLTDEEVQALEEHLTVTLAEVHQAVALVFGDDPENAATVWDSLSEAIAMVRLLGSLLGAFSPDETDDLAGAIFGPEAV